VEREHDGRPEGDGPPPTPWERDTARRDRRNILLSALVAIVLGVPMGLATWNMIGQAGDVDLSGVADEQASGPSEDGAPGEDRSAVEVPDLDLDALSGQDEAIGRVLVDVDRSEEAMLAAQADISAAFEEVDPDDPDGEAVADDISEAAGAGQRELQEIREDLASPVEDEVARELRDRYLTHLDAWVRYLVAVEREPGILVSEDADTAMLLAIDTTGDAFAQVIREDLPADLDEDVREMADAIVERGFPERELSEDDTV
jgi:hypothetical protein